MKTFALALKTAACLTVAALAVWLTGCTTTSQVTTTATGSVTNNVTTLDTNKVVNAINIAVPAAVRIAVAKEPKVAPYLQDVVLAIALATGSGNITPQAIEAAVKSAGVNELKTPEALSAVDAAVAIYQGAYSQQVNAWVNRSADLSVILQALSGAIQRGLSPE